MAEKAEFPTSAYQVECDHFDSKLVAKFHKPKGETKLAVTMFDANGEVRLSLYREDVEALGKFLLSVSEHVDKR